MTVPPTKESGELIPADEMERIRNYLAQWSYTVGTETPEGVPLAQQLLRHIESLEGRIADYERYVEREIEPRLIQTLQIAREALKEIVSGEPFGSLYLQEIARAALERIE